MIDPPGQGKRSACYDYEAIARQARAARAACIGNVLAALGQRAIRWGIDRWTASVRRHRGAQPPGRQPTQASAAHTAGYVRMLTTCRTEAAIKREPPHPGGLP